MRTALSEYEDDSVTAVKKYGTIDTWDVSVIRDFSFLFSYDYLPAGADLSNWITSSAVTMTCAAVVVSALRSSCCTKCQVPACGRNMFAVLSIFHSDHLSLFNSDLNRWDVSRVTDMSCAQ